MLRTEIETLGRYDALWLSPHPHDALLSGTGRLLRARASGQRSLLVTVFGEDRQRPEVLAALGLDHLHLGLEAAHRRGRHYAVFSGRVFGSHADDATEIERLTHIVEDLGHRTKARDVFLPLGVGGDVDHRILHEAGARVFPVGPSQNILFYEDRPYALAAGAVRLRLGQLAARLPPAITDVGDRAGLLRHIHGFLRLAVVRRNVHGLRDRMRCLWLAAGAWRRAKGWQPRKAFGPRLQPLVDPIDSRLAAEIDQTLTTLGPELLHLIGSVAAARQAAVAYARRLGQPPTVERYWLLLPPREADGVTALSASAGPRR